MPKSEGQRNANRFEFYENGQIPNKRHTKEIDL